MAVRTNKKQQKMVKAAEAAEGTVVAKVEPKGLKVARYFSSPFTRPLDDAEYVKRSSAIYNPDGSAVFRMDDVEVPKSWSQLATDIVVSKYFRKRGVPGVGFETSVKQVVHRIVRTIRMAGELFGGYFATK
jgi:ribonucleoside-diphosphate reductase alpha chain